LEEGVTGQLLKTKLLGKNNCMKIQGRKRIRMYLPPPTEPRESHQKGAKEAEDEADLPPFPRSPKRPRGPI
jgi:hypothetical protein